MDTVVLHVPTLGALAVNEPDSPLGEHLSFTVRLPANRVVPQEEASREDEAPWKAHLVTAGGRQVNSGAGLLPALDLQAVVPRGRRVESERLANVLTGADGYAPGQKSRD